MKISRDWLQTFFSHTLPGSAELADALTFHAFEIESIKNDILDVKVTPNRGHDCLSHRGIAREISAILDLPMHVDPLLEQVSLEKQTQSVRVDIEVPALCPRFTGAHIRNVRVAESPDWLKNALESVGQRPINNVVDITNYVMFHIGQPLHAFDMTKLREKDGKRALKIREARKGESLVGLDEKKYELSDSMVVIEDAHAHAAVSIAGIKGGLPTGIDEDTTEIFIEAANWDGVTIRKTSQSLKLRTDASSRFEQVISSDLAAYGTRAAVDLVLKETGGDLVGYVDEYPVKQEKKTVRVSAGLINTVLGTRFSAEDVARVFKRLGLAHEERGEDFDVFVPFERLDLSIAEDLTEEVGRILGYEHVQSAPLRALPGIPDVHQHFARSELMREFLKKEGFSEVFTSVFSSSGDRVVLNKIDGTNPYLRKSIKESLQEALERNVRNKDLLNLRQVKIFEIGTVWKGGKEEIEIELAVEKVKGQKTADEYREMLDAYLVSLGELRSYEELPSAEEVRYEPFSKYPCIVRDIAMWVPLDSAQGKPEATSEEVLRIIRDAAGDMLVQSALFDEFKKDGRTSYAFRLVFQSFDKTLTDGEANERMDSVNAAVKDKGWEVR